MIHIKGISKTIARKAGTVQATIKVEASQEWEFTRFAEFVKLWNKFLPEQMDDLLAGVKAKEVLQEVKRLPVHRLAGQAGLSTMCGVHMKTDMRAAPDQFTREDDEVTCSACLREIDATIQRNKRMGLGK